MIEIYKDIAGYEGYYQVSNFGNVKSLDRTLKNKWGNYIRRGKVMAANKANRYLTVNLFINWKFKHCKIHRLVAAAFIPNPDNKPEVNHVNGDRYDNRIENLEWVTTSENEFHAYKIGIKKPLVGEKNPAAILTNDKVLEIKRRYASENTSMRKLAKEYGVCASTISGIVNNKFWNHIKKAA